MNYPFCACVLLVVVSAAVADDHTFTFCTRNVTKCQLAKTNFTCKAKTGDSCTKDVVDGKADMALASADDLVKYMDELKVVYGQKLKDLEKFVYYYGLAVVQKGTTFNFTELKGKNSCHTGVGRTVGWKIPVGYLLYTAAMNFTDNQYKSAADYFGDSCAPGSKDIKATDAVKEDLCKLCNGSCKTDSTEGYLGYVGAFVCMAEGNKDRVGFVKQTTPDEVFTKYKSKYGNASNYQLLCKNGKKKDLDKYMECYIDARPAHALVTRKNVTGEDLKEMQALLDAYNLTDLAKTGMVSSNIEKLEPYNDTLKEYVGDYGHYINALNRIFPTTPPPSSPLSPSLSSPSSPSTTSSPSVAPSIALSFALQIIAFVVLAFLAA